jgi:hypothetical protein
MIYIPFTLESVAVLGMKVLPSVWIVSIVVSAIVSLQERKI